jgi:hypothetical protein
MSLTATKIYGFPVIYKGTIVDNASQAVIIKSAPLPTNNFYFICTVKTALGVERANITSTYDKTTGIVTIANVATLITGDTFVIEGIWTTR